MLSYLGVHKMNSTIFDESSRENLAQETAKSLKNIFDNTVKVTDLHRDLLEVNLSITAYIEESNKHLKELRYKLALKAKSSSEVIDIYSEQCKFREQRNISRESSLASPHSPEIVKIRPDNVITGNPRKRSLRSRCKSPEWAPGCGPDSELNGIAVKRLRGHGGQDDKEEDVCDTIRRHIRELPEINNKGDGIITRGLKRKCVQVTPPNREVGQGDCLPSTSSNSPSNTPKKAVECNGYIEFSRPKNSRTTEAMKWERKCKVQISYSEDPYNVGEYIIWEIHYSDENRCRRNLLAAFEEVSLQECSQND